jgi:hypothetical protein
MLLALVAACSSSSSSAPSPSSTGAAALRAADARPLLVQCALSRGLMKHPAGQSSWLHGMKVVITPSDSGGFDEWYALNNATVISGKELYQWAQSAAAAGKLPPQVCGTSVTASALQRQVFAQYPAAGDPWRA